MTGPSWIVASASHCLYVQDERESFGSSVKDFMAKIEFCSRLVQINKEMILGAKRTYIRHTTHCVRSLFKSSYERAWTTFGLKLSLDRGLRNAVFLLMWFLIKWLKCVISLNMIMSSQHWIILPHGIPQFMKNIVIVIMLGNMGIFQFNIMFWKFLDSITRYCQHCFKSMICLRKFTIINSF